MTMASGPFWGMVAIIAVTGVITLACFVAAFWMLLRPGEHDPRRLADLRRQDIILAVGKDDGLRGQNERLSTLLWDKQIGNALRLWDGWSHDWPYWKQMMRLYVGGHD